MQNTKSLSSRWSGRRKKEMEKAEERHLTVYQVGSNPLCYSSFNWKQPVWELLNYAWQQLCRCWAETSQRKLMWHVPVRNALWKDLFYLVKGFGCGFRLYEALIWHAALWRSGSSSSAEQHRKLRLLFNATQLKTQPVTMKKSSISSLGSPAGPPPEWGGDARMGDAILRVYSDDWISG